MTHIRAFRPQGSQGPRNPIFEIYAHFNIGPTNFNRGSALFGLYFNRGTASGHCLEALPRGSCSFLYGDWAAGNTAIVMPESPGGGGGADAGASDEEELDDDEDDLMDEDHVVAAAAARGVSPVPSAPPPTNEVPVAVDPRAVE